MTKSEWIMVAAIVAGPILAVQAQKWLETVRDKKNRRLWVFKRLMTTRGATASPGHVEALNAIDLEFAGWGKKNRAVRQRWRAYLDQLGSLSQDPEQQQRQLESWAQRNQEHLENLLYDMSLAVGYDFDIVQIRRGIYTPRGLTNFEFETQAIRRLAIDLLAGNRALPMDIRSVPNVSTATSTSPGPPPQATIPNTGPESSSSP
jgi:hypothetical protein